MLCRGTYKQIAGAVCENAILKNNNIISLIFTQPASLKVLVEIIIIIINFITAPKGLFHNNLQIKICIYIYIIVLSQ